MIRATIVAISTERERLTKLAASEVHAGHPAVLGAQYDAPEHFRVQAHLFLKQVLAARGQHLLEPVKQGIHFLTLMVIEARFSYQLVSIVAVIQARFSDPFISP